MKFHENLLIFQGTNEVPKNPRFFQESCNNFKGNKMHREKFFFNFKTFIDSGENR